MFSQMTVKLFKCTAHAEEKFSPFSHIQSLFTGKLPTSYQEIMYEQESGQIPVNIFWQSYRSYGDDMINLSCLQGSAAF